MKKTLISIILTLVVSCSHRTNENISSNKLSFTFNKNIETYFLAEILSAEHRTINRDFEIFKTQECSNYQPIVEKALIQLNHLKKSDISKKTAKINDVLLSKYGIGKDRLMEALLSHEEFPSKNWKTSYVFRDIDLDEQQNTEISLLIRNYVDDLCEFYTSENLSEFFEENLDFYLNGINEFKKHVPDDFVVSMETIYKEGFSAYNVIISPMMMWPIVDNEGRGIGASININNNIIIYEIASPFVKVEKKGEYGYNNEFQAKFLTLHEFGHSFINHEVDKQHKELKKFKLVFENSMLKSRMIEVGGYGDYLICVSEHLVRLGEIEIVLFQNDTVIAKKLYQYHMKNDFIFLPLLREKLKEYKGNPEKYETFSDFIPYLLEVFESTSEEFINEELSKSQPNQSLFYKS